MKGFFCYLVVFGFCAQASSLFSCTVLFLLLRRILYKAADTCGASFLDCCFEVLVGDLLL